MKKLLASAMAAIVLISFVYIDFPKQAIAESTEKEVENAIRAAIQWKNENDNPFESIGEDASDIYVTALARGGIDFDYDKYLDGLDKMVGEFSKSTNVFDMQRVLMAVVSSGGDGQYIGGRDLVANSTYFKEDLGYSGVLEYIYALILLNARDFEVPEDWAYNTYEDMIYAILSEQADDGSFGDVYTTACAVIALSPYNNDYEYSFTNSDGEIINESGGNAIYKAVKFLSEQQSEYGDFYTSTDTALVSMAMDSIGLKEDDERFVKDNNTVIDGLLTYRNDNGGFTADYNDVDSLSTSYALCALISNIRVREDKAQFFDFTTFDSINIDIEDNVSGTSKPSATTRPDTTIKPIRTTAPKVTTKPKVTIKPKTTVKPAVTPKTTPKPTKKPDLVGPVRLVGPEAPIETVAPIGTMVPLADNEADAKTVPVVLSVVCVLAIAGAVCLMLFKNKLLSKPKKQENKKVYKAKSHRKTEERRKYENRRKYNERRKYQSKRR